MIECVDSHAKSPYNVKTPTEEYIMFVAYNHNGTLICKGSDLGNVAEEAMFYEEVTGNKTYIEEVA